MKYKVGTVVRIKHGIEDCVARYSGRIEEIKSIDRFVNPPIYALGDIEIGFYENEIEPAKINIQQLLRERSG